MKYFLATYDVQDGEHVHTKYGIVAAENEQAATIYAKSQEHDMEAKEVGAKRTYWDYGDGMTASQLWSVTAITKEEADLLQRLEVAVVMD
jgi:hypothetical protein